MNAIFHERISFAPDMPAARVAPGAAGAPSYRGVFGAIRLYFARQHAIHRLNSLSDRSLADIGVIRENIPQVVRGNLRRG